MCWGEDDNWKENSHTINGLGKGRGGKGREGRTAIQISAPLDICSIQDIHRKGEGSSLDNEIIKVLECQSQCCTVMHIHRNLKGQEKT